VSRPVVIRPAAATEIEVAFQWYEREQQGLGADFLAAVDHTITTVASDPDRFPVIRKNVRRALVRRFPYAVLYRVVSETVVVIACFHGKRNPQIWSSRKEFQRLFGLQPPFDVLPISELLGRTLTQKVK